MIKRHSLFYLQIILTNLSRNKIEKLILFIFFRRNKLIYVYEFKEIFIYFVFDKTQLFLSANLCKLRRLF
ncbi:hypothetical protein B7486_43505 [cyanobacterium TDX16]|nr:hypothetical protein B7486_43505 [cyanobacterium TDX16]